MPDPDGGIVNRDLSDEIITSRLFSSTGLVIPDAPIHAESLRMKHMDALPTLGLKRPGPPP